MIRPLLIIFLLFFSNSTTAQSDFLVVINSKGTANYAKEDGTQSQEMIPGLTIPINGTIFLDDDATVKLIVNQKFVLLKGEGRYDVKEIFDSNTKKSMSFSARFWKFVTAGMSSKNDKQELAKYHQQYMNVHGGVKGYSSDKSDITLITPLHGNLASDQITLDWESKKSHPINIDILNNERTLLDSFKSDVGQIDIDLSTLELKEGEQYFVKLSDSTSENDGGIETSFVFVPGQLDKAIEWLNYLPAYNEGSSEEQDWIKANFLEMEKFYYDTYVLYKQMTSQTPENLLLKKTFATFLVRQDQLASAQAVFN